MLFLFLALHLGCRRKDEIQEHLLQVNLLVLRAEVVEPEMIVNMFGLWELAHIHIMSLGFPHVKPVNFANAPMIIGIHLSLMSASLQSKHTGSILPGVDSYLMKSSQSHQEPNRL